VTSFWNNISDGQQSSDFNDTTSTESVAPENLVDVLNVLNLYPRVRPIPKTLNILVANSFIF